MAQVSGKIIQELSLILTPFMRDKQQRQAYLELALGTNSPVLGNLEWDGSANVFITQMVNKLVAFGEILPGKPALCALLEVVRENVGLDKQLEIDNLLQRIRQELKKQQPPSGIWRCLHTLNEHSGSVESVAISPDGRILASGSSDKTINLWELNTGRLLYTMKGHSTIVRSVAFSPDGKTLASSSNIDTTNGNIKLWDVYTGKLRQTLGGGLSTFRVNSLAFNPEGNIIATGQVNIIKLWDLKTGKELDTLWGHAIDVNSLAFTPDGQFLVAGCSQGEIKIWDWQNRSPLRTINPAGNLLGSIVSLFNPNGMLWSVVSRFIAPAGGNGTTGRTAENNQCILFS